MLGQYVPPLGGVIIADFLVIWGLREIPRMEDVDFTGVRWTAVVAYLVGCVAAVLTAGSVIPGVAAPQLLPGMTSLNGVIAAGTVHLIGYYAREQRGILPGHEILADAETV